MALNATAALALAAELGLDVDTVVASWADFGGVHRRFESHGDGGGRAGVRRLRPPPDRDRGVARRGAGGGSPAAAG